jgi:2-phospho-L-lactate guanylyltransferase (CobY/MobA/RfbA family)
MAEAETSGARIEIVESTSLGLDLDIPEDLEILQQLQQQELKPS